MLRAEIRWLANGPTLKVEGRLVGDWAEQASSLVTKDAVPLGLIIDLSEVSYVDSAGEELLKWLATVGAQFVADSVYALAVCERLRLPLRRNMPARRRQRFGIMGASNSDMYSHATEPDPARH